jgi:hypothetical protein
MANILIMRPLPFTVVGVSHGTGGINLTTQDPKEVWSGNAGADNQITIDLGTNLLFDTIMLGFATVTATGGAPTWRAQSGFGGTGDLSWTAHTPIISAGAIGPRYHALLRRPAPVDHRFIRIDVYSPTTPTVGIIAVGLPFQPTYNQEWGGGRQIIDTGAKERLLGGGFGIGDGARKAGYRWTLGDLSDAETHTLYGLALSRGDTQPLVVVEDPDQTAGLNERIHYGLFDKLEAYERRNPSQTRWSLSIEQWV